MKTRGLIWVMAAGTLGFIAYHNDLAGAYFTLGVQMIVRIARAIEFEVGRLLGN